MKKLDNLLISAIRVIPPVAFLYRKYTGHATNDIGNTIAEYTEWTEAVGVVQPGIPSSFGTGRILGEEAIKLSGIDFSRNVISVWCKDVDIRSVRGKTIPDQVMYEDKVYNITDVADWLGYNGWKRLVCEEDIRDE